jgi:flagellar biosynthetic protein FlhB
MAEDQDSASRTEEATPRRLEEARKEGDVAKSAELAQVCALAGTFAALAVGGGWFSRNLAVALVPFLAHPESMQLRGAPGVALARQVILAAAPAMLIVLGATILGGVGGNVVQQGFLFTPGKLRPDPSKLSPAAGFKRLFGVDGLVSFLRSLLKVVLVTSVAWWVLAPRAKDLPGLIGKQPLAVLTYGVDLSRSLMMAILALLALIALIDYLWQRQRFSTRMRMTKEQLKEDYRQSEGDPRVKARQRQIRLERARRRMIQAVPKATVVVVNPTHFAVALRYKQGETPAPECIAKGVDAVAFKIREVAEAHGVPVVEDPPLARALYGVVEVDEIIPQQHYEAVAKIIGFIFAGKRGGRRAMAPQGAMMAR